MSTLNLTPLNANVENMLKQITSCNFGKQFHHNFAQNPLLSSQLSCAQSGLFRLLTDTPTLTHTHSKLTTDRWTICCSNSPLSIGKTAPLNSRQYHGANTLSAWLACRQYCGANTTFGQWLIPHWLCWTSSKVTYQWMLPRDQSIKGVQNWAFQVIFVLPINPRSCPCQIVSTKT